MLLDRGTEILRFFARTYSANEDLITSLFVFKCNKSVRELALVLVAIYLSLSILPLTIVLVYSTLVLNKFKFLFFHKKSKTIMSNFPSSVYLPLIGETVQFKSNRRFEEYGGIFQTHLDFSGYYLLARPVTCVRSDALCCSLRRDKMSLMATVGYYGPSFVFASKVPQLAQILLNDRDRIPVWERKATAIVQDFLRGIAGQSCFSFADKVNVLACELLTSIFLNMDGLSPALFEAFERYVSLSQHSPLFNATHRPRQALVEAVACAVFEQDRRFFSQQPPGGKEKDETIYEALDVIGALIVGEQCAGDQERYEMFFVFLVEYCYRSLVRQLRSLLHLLLARDSDMLDSAFRTYQSYLAARQAAGSIPARRVERYCWASVAAETVTDATAGGLSADRLSRSSSAKSELKEESKVESESSINGSQHAENAAVTDAPLNSATQDTYDYNQLASISKLKDVVDTSLSPSDERLEDLLTPVFLHSKFLECPRGAEYQSSVASNAEHYSSPPSVLSLQSTGKAGRKFQRLRQEQLAKEYIKCIETITETSLQAVKLEQPPLCYSLWLCHEGFDLQDPTTVNKVYEINTNDIVLQLHNTDYLCSDYDPQDDDVAHASTIRATRRLGCLSNLILNIFAHELIIAYRWTYEPTLIDKFSDEEPIPDHSLFVWNFHSVSTLPFCVTTWEEEEDDTGDSTSSGSGDSGRTQGEDEERYYSDGL
eukprot:gene31672-38276_t